MGGGWGVGGKSYRRFEGKSDLPIWGGGVKHNCQFGVNRHCRFGGVNRHCQFGVNQHCHFGGVGG